MTSLLPVAYAIKEESSDSIRMIYGARVSLEGSRVSQKTVAQLCLEKPGTCQAR